jgi:hypothetical protein
MDLLIEYKNTELNELEKTYVSLGKLATASSMYFRRIKHLSFKPWWAKKKVAEYFNSLN